MPQKRWPADALPVFNFVSKHTAGGCLLDGYGQAGQLKSQPKIPTVPPTPWVLMSTAWLPTSPPAGQDPGSRHRLPLAAQAEKPSLHTHAPLLHTCCNFVLFSYIKEDIIFGQCVHV